MSGMSATLTVSEADKRRELKKAARASFIGNFIEWFDYASYGYLAIIIGGVFFPEGNKTVQLMLTFAVFAMSFVFRPIGAILWGAWGDRYGRRWALSWSILLMSISTFLVGCLPGYETWGIMAPLSLLFLRSIQGFSASGEYAGAATFLAEYAPKEKRGLYTSLVPASTAAGLLAGSVLISFMVWALDDAAMHSWGWRLPFLAALPLGFIGRYIRVHLEDSPVFQSMQENIEEKEVVKKEFPLADLLKNHGLTTLIAFGVSSLNAVAFYLLLSYMPSYVSTELNVDLETSTLISSVMLLVYIGAISVMGHYSDKFGRRTMLIGASVAFVIFSVPLLWLMGTGGVWVILLCQIIFAIILTANDGTLATFLAESFPTEVRYSGFALAFNGANALLGGTAPLIATWLINVTGSKLAPAIYLAVIAALALIAMFFARDNSSLSLKKIDQQN